MSSKISHEITVKQLTQDHTKGQETLISVKATSIEEVLQLFRTVKEEIDVE